MFQLILEDWQILHGRLW